MLLNALGGQVDPEQQVYWLRFTASQGRALAAQLLLSDDEFVRSTGRKLQLYFKPVAASGCSDCGGSGAEFTSPESCALTELWLDGLRAHCELKRLICRTCLRRYYVDRGEADPFPQDGPLEARGA